MVDSTPHYHQQNTRAPETWKIHTKSYVSCLGAQMLGQHLKILYVDVSDISDLKKI